MKKIIFFVLILTISVSLFSQVKTGSAPELKTDYLQKSKGQGTIAYATGISGILLLTIGGIMSLSEFGNGLPGGTGYNETTARTGDALMIAGSGLVLVAIPFQLAARKNKKLAIAMAIKTEPIQQLQKNSFIKKSAPSLALKISL